MPMVDALRREADPFSPEAVVMRLAAGEWQCALKLLERQQCDVCRDCHPDPRDWTSVDLTDLSSMRLALSNSLGGLPWEVRADIAQKLLAADAEAE